MRSTRSSRALEGLSERGLLRTPEDPIGTLAQVA